MARRRRSRFKQVRETSFIEAQKRLLKELAAQGWHVERNVASRSKGSVERIQIDPVLQGAIHYWGPVRASRVALGHSSDGWADIRKISADDILRWVADEQRIEFSSMREPGKMSRMHAAENPTRRRRGHSVPTLALSDTRLSTWEERDRAHVELINTKNDATIIEWWDEAVGEAIQDGFLNPRKLHESAYDYAVHIGLIQRPQHSHWTQTEHPLPRARENQYEDMKRAARFWADAKGWEYFEKGTGPIPVSWPGSPEGLWQFYVVKRKGGQPVMVRVSHAELTRDVQENPVANDFTDPTPALRAAMAKYGATHVVWEERQRTVARKTKQRIHGMPVIGDVQIFSPRRGGGFWKRTAYVKKGYWHWPEQGDVVKSLPSNAEKIEDVVHRESQEARECGCEHCGMPRENPVEVSDGIPWVTTERNVEDFNEVRAVAEKVGEIKNSRDIYNLMHPWTSRQDQEHLCVVLVDIHSMLRGVAMVHKGMRDRVSVDPEDVLKPAIDRGAKGLAILHNHPSGQAEPSSADRDLTKAIKAACKPAGIAFMDHLVVGSGEYYSFADKKLHKVRSR